MRNRSRTVGPQQHHFSESARAIAERRAALLSSWELERSGPCGTVQRIFEAREAAAPSTIYGFSADGRCVPLGTQASQNVRYAGAGNAASLQALRRESVAGPGRLLAVDFVDDQGIRIPIRTEWFDQARNAGCEFKKAADGQSRCLPQSTTSLVFTDAACTRTVAVSRSAPCYATPTTAARLIPDTCGNRFHYWERGAKLAELPSEVYLPDLQGRCVPLTNYPFTEAYAVGAEIPATVFVGGSLQME